MNYINTSIRAHIRGKASGQPAQGSLKKRIMGGFTLIEILTVVTIIGILAAITIPVVGEVRKTSQVKSTAASLKTFSGILQGMDDVAVLPLTEGTIVQATVAEGTNLVASTAANLANALRLDQVLISLGKTQSFFETPMVSVKLASGTTTAADPRWNKATNRFYNTPDTTLTHSWANCARIENAVANPASVPGVDGLNYRLDGVSNLTAGARVQYAVLPGITSEMAFKLGETMNNAALMESTSPGSAQTKGIVTWAAPTNGLTTVYVYLGTQ